MKRALPILVLMFGMIAVVLWPRHKSEQRAPDPSKFVEITASSNPPTIVTSPPAQYPAKSSGAFRKRLTEFSDAERDKFEADFRDRYKPAIERWAAAFEGHLPFWADDVTPDKLAERIGIDDNFGEHVFVVNGITLGIREAGGNAAVDYLNNPAETRKLATLPKNQGPPKTERPISRDELIAKLELDCGQRFQPHEVRIKPSGFSGSLNGGSLVQVGGNPANSATWKYDIVISADGKLAYYLRTF